MEADVFLLCFSLDNPESLQNIEIQWFPMLQKKHSNANVILVGLKSDLKDSKNLQITQKQCEYIADGLNFSKYLECSANTHTGVKKFFDEAILSCLNYSAQSN